MEGKSKLTGALGKLKTRKRSNSNALQEWGALERNLADLQKNKLVEKEKEKKVLQWYCTSCEKACLQIREESRCMCGHRLKYHDTKGKRRCKENRCTCKCFFYIVAEGSWMLRCQCKHKGVDHDPNTHACKKNNCACTKFNSPWVCNCDCPWSAHKQRETTILVKTFSVDEGDTAVFNEVNPWQDLKRGQEKEPPSCTIEEIFD